MDIISQMMLKVNMVFDEKNLEKIARETGFIQRKRKMTAKAFLEKGMFLRLEQSKSSLEDLAYEFNQSHTPISKQALHKKCNRAAVDFVQKVLEKLLEHAVCAQKTDLSALPWVKRVQVIDSSEIRFHEALKALFPQVRNQGAAIKLQALMDVVNHQIHSLEARPSKEPDQGYKKHIARVEADDLLIGDLGYFCVDTFHEIQTKKGFFLSRYFKQTHVYDLTTDQRIDLRARLDQSQDQLMELPIALGASRFPCRLVAIRLTEAAYQQRLNHLKEKRRQDPRSKGNQRDKLNQWTIFITNLPSSVKADILLKVYSLRWQIELLFKMMKTFLNLRRVDSVNPYRASIALYLSLIAMTLLSFVVATMVDKEISLYKAGKLFIKNIRKFFSLINSDTCAISWLKERLGRFILKESRPKRPSTKLMLGASYA